MLWLAFVGMVNSVVSLSYYWKIIRVLYIVPAKTEEELRTPPSLTVALAVTGVLVVGVLPGPLLDLIRTAAQTVFGG
jgi:NADH:ubiquinone oxidoreductase subunit 2 (subunit N)